MSRSHSTRASPSPLPAREQRIFLQTLISKKVHLMIRVLFVALCIVCIECIVEAGRPGVSKLTFSKEWSECEQLCVPQQAAKEEHVNCVLKCVCPPCFSRLYEKQPLEDGEVDERRRSQYDSCVNTHMRSARHRSEWKADDNVSQEDKTRRDSEWI